MILRKIINADRSDKLSLSLMGSQSILLTLEYHVINLIFNGFDNSIPIE